jgi:MFS family permease
MLLPILREYAHERLGIEMQQLALLALPAALTLLVALRLAGPATDRFGRATVTAVGSLAAAAGIACLAIGESSLMFTVGFVPLAAGYAACAVALNAWITDIADNSAAAVGVTLTVQGIAFAFGPALTGLLLARGGLDWALWGAAIVWAPAALCVVLAPARREHPERERTI